jgi:hypothetical protein
VGTLIHPSGASGTFTLKLMMHGRSNVPGSEEACEGPHYINGLSRANLVSRYFANYTLISKGLGGPGMPGMTWTYDYSTARGSFAPCNGCIATKTVTITDPQAHVIQKTFGTRFRVDDGLLLAWLRDLPHSMRPSGPLLPVWRRRPNSFPWCFPIVTGRSPRAPC